MLGTFKADVKIVDDQTISVDGKLIKVVSNRDPLKLPWAELGIDIVIEVHKSTIDCELNLQGTELTMLHCCVCHVGYRSVRRRPRRREAHPGRREEGHHHCSGEGC